MDIDFGVGSGVSLGTFLMTLSGSWYMVNASGSSGSGVTPYVNPVSLSYQDNSLGYQLLQSPFSYTSSNVTGNTTLTSSVVAGSQYMSGDTVQFTIYSYTLVNGSQRVYSTGDVTTALYTIPSNNNQISSSWSASIGVSGYRVVVNKDSRFGANGNYYFDTPNASFLIQSASIGLDLGSGNSYTYGNPIILTPTSILNVYPVFLTGNSSSPSISISQSAWYNSYDYKPYLWLKSITDGYWYQASASGPSGSVVFSINQNSKINLSSLGY
jgi:hypothetical protein